MLKEIFDNDWIKEIYNKVDEFEKNNKAWAHHDYNHVIRVAEIARKLAEKLKYNNEIIEDIKIACILHDIGCINGKENHAYRSYIMAKEYLEHKKINLRNKDIILEAIKDHSNGFESNNIVTLILLVADKLDIDKRRIAKQGYFIEGMRQLQYINSIEIDIENQVLKINFIIDNQLNSKELEKFYFMKKVQKGVKAFCIKNKLNYLFMKNGQKWYLEV